MQECYTEYQLNAPKRKKKKNTNEIQNATVSASVEAESNSENDVFSADRVIQPGNSSSLYNFIPATKMKGMEDFVEENDQLKYYEESSEFKPTISCEDEIDFPSLLKVFLFPRGDTRRFSSPKRGTYGTLSKSILHAYFVRLSILPVVLQTITLWTELHCYQSLQWIYSPSIQS